MTEAFCIKLLLTSALVLIGAVAIAAPSIVQNIDDDSAIRVFPDHNEIARNPESIAQAIEDGRALFRTKFNLTDGAGRPFATGDSKPTPRLLASGNFGRIAGPDASAGAECDQGLADSARPERRTEGPFGKNPDRRRAYLF